MEHLLCDLARRARAVDRLDSLREHLCELAVGGVDPRAEVVVLALDAVALGADAARRLDRIEREDGDFRERVDAAYRELAEFFPQRITTIDGTRPPREIAEEIIGELRQHS